MKITPDAQKALKSVLADNNADGLLVSLQETCCGISPVFSLAVFDENDKPVDVDSIQIVVPQEAQSAIEDVTIDLVNGELVVESTGGCSCSSGGCGGGCSH
jgi:Fe-S cluster assembly iron-binding protein IscA